jgi:hypothetical protein
MIRKIFATTTLTIGLCAFAQANQNLEVVFDGCKPVEVLSHDASCGNGPDPKDMACRPNNGPVRWVPVSSIKEITSKPGTAGGLHNCEPKANYYQCIVRGNVGDDVYYNVISTDGCSLDPVIRVR